MAALAQRCASAGSADGARLGSTFDISSTYSVSCSSAVILRRRLRLHYVQCGTGHLLPVFGIFTSRSASSNMLHPTRSVDQLQLLLVRQPTHIPQSSCAVQSRTLANCNLLSDRLSQSVSQCTRAAVVMVCVVCSNPAFKEQAQDMLTADARQAVLQCPGRGHISEPIYCNAKDQQGVSSCLFSLPVSVQ